MFEELVGRKVHYIDEENYRKFSVVVPLVRKDGELHVVFEKRANFLRRQPGEICLPGGAREAGETARENAVRETCEELNIEKSQIRVITQLNTLSTIYNNEVSVFLCQLDNYQMTYDHCEVAEVFLVPLKFFLDTQPDIYFNTVQQITPEDFPYSKIPKGRDYFWGLGKRKVYFYYFGDYTIWGMTAYIMQNAAFVLKEEAANSLALEYTH